MRVILLVVFKRAVEAVGLLFVDLVFLACESGMKVRMREESELCDKSWVWGVPARGVLQKLQPKCSR